MQEDMESIMEKLKEKDKFILVLLVHFLKNTEDKNKAKQL
jgi:multimeric flavodoxin WrbA